MRRAFEIVELAGLDRPEQRRDHQPGEYQRERY